MARIVELLIGVALLAAPDLFGYDGPARVNHLVVGPTAACIAVIAMSEVLRELRWVNLALGAWLILSVLLVPHEVIALGMGVTSGMGLILLALVRGPIRQRLGGGWPQVLRPDRTKSEEPEGSET